MQSGLLRSCFAWLKDRVFDKTVWGHWRRLNKCQHWCESWSHEEAGAAPGEKAGVVGVQLTH